MIKQISVILLVFVFSFNALNALSFHGGSKQKYEKRLEKVELKHKKA